MRNTLKNLIIDQKNICYHGNKQHLDFIDINLEKALLKLKMKVIHLKQSTILKN